MIELKAEHIEKLQKLLENTPKQIPIVTARAINRAAEASRTQAARSARETYIIKHKDIISTIKIKKAYPSDLTAEIRSVGGPIPLTKFKVKPNTPLPTHGKYAVVSVKKGSRKTIKKSFIAAMANGHTNVFTRVSKKRNPIRGHYGPSIPQMLGSNSVVSHVESRAMEVLDDRLTHEINRMLGGSS